ncbi:hypothetical protein EDD18DRAFT_1108471 [Armillaria luteobubalina]|uniref:CxC2-like cysteine cluster KDZ transposase-associated domain-containing protein n=1 Tax=Armillaria luteobubalina TaxID=153913 RepID=A0AA39PZF5_9AGAR|nr:hypothetical protein EDD18DRAFT_1108471 [Armillaria luteobubalina]
MSLNGLVKNMLIMIPVLQVLLLLRSSVGLRMEHPLHMPSCNEIMSFLVRQALRKWELFLTMNLSYIIGFLALGQSLYQQVLIGLSPYNKMEYSRLRDGVNIFTAVYDAIDVSSTTANPAIDISSTTAAIVPEDETNNTAMMGSSTQAGSSKVPPPQSHRHLPFHRIEKWNGHYFEKVTLRSLGYVFYLGHDGHPCPNQLSTAVRRTIVVDINGYHDVDFMYCFCRDKEIDEAKQLLQHLLFPATVVHPETVFTTEVLDQFDVHHCTSTKSAETFCSSLQKITNAGRPYEVLDLYHTFMQAGSWHKYTLFLDCNGTFNVPCINKPDDPYEEALNVGRAYVIEEHEYQKYLSQVENDPPDKCDCAKLQALKFEHLMKFINLVVTGIVSVQLDMYAGERLYYADQEMQCWVHLSYDLVCQYLPKLLECITRNIGQLHIVSHIDICKAVFSFNYTPGTGHSCGDNVESPWAKTKCAGGSLNQMNHGLHHDMLDFLLGDWNWSKVVGLAWHLRVKYTEAVGTKGKLETAFQALTAMHAPEVIKQWEAEYYCPTMQSMVTDLLEKERTALLSDEPITGMREGITEVIMEEHDPKYQSETEEAQLQATQRALYHNTLEWLRVIVHFFPGVHAVAGSVDAQHPETAKLPIPSQLTANQHVRYGVDGLISIKYSLRVGQAHDILAKIHELIIGQSYNTQIVCMEFHGQRMQTRAHDFITRFKLDKLDAMHRYNHIRKCLISLGMSSTNTDLCELKEGHLTAKNAVQSRELGDSSKLDSWLWGAIKPENLSESAEEEWVTETEVWTEIAKKSDMESGASAYAYKVADVYRNLATHYMQEWEKALKKVEQIREEDHHRQAEEDIKAQEEDKLI